MAVTQEYVIQGSDDSTASEGVVLGRQDLRLQTGSCGEPHEGRLSSASGILTVECVHVAPKANGFQVD